MSNRKYINDLRQLTKYLTGILGAPARFFINSVWEKAVSADKKELILGEIDSMVSKAFAGEGKIDEIIHTQMEALKQKVTGCDPFFEKLEPKLQGMIKKAVEKGLDDLKKVE